MNVLGVMEEHMAWATTAGWDDCLAAIQDAVGRDTVRGSPPKAILKYTNCWKIFKGTIRSINMIVYKHSCLTKTVKTPQTHVGGSRPKLWLIEVVRLPNIQQVQSPRLGVA